MADSDIENDNTGTSNDQGNNVSEIKMSTSSKCMRCGRDLESHENIICDECLQEVYEERLAE
jgi:predicted amidophosphoribosyltransferase